MILIEDVEWKLKELCYPWFFYKDIIDEDRLYYRLVVHKDVAISKDGGWYVVFPSRGTLLISGTDDIFMEEVPCRYVFNVMFEIDIYSDERYDVIAADAMRFAYRLSENGKMFKGELLVTEVPEIKIKYGGNVIEQKYEESIQR